MTLSSTQISTHYLVLTAIGKNKTGLVSELSGLVSQCQCNVIDSKMAIFGSEFTMIMLLAGDSASLVQLEMQLPPLAMRLELLTMMKRTTKHQDHNTSKFLVTIEGPDRAGTIQALTSYLAKNDVDISSLKSETMVKDAQDWQIAEFVVDLPDSIDVEQLDTGFSKECQSLAMTCSFSPITIETQI